MSSDQQVLKSHRLKVFPVTTMETTHRITFFIIKKTIFANLSYTEIMCTDDIEANPLDFLPKNTEPPSLTCKLNNPLILKQSKARHSTLPDLTRLSETCQGSGLDPRAAPKPSSEKGG